MQLTVKKWGNSASIRIPVAILNATGLHLDSKVDIREENGRIIIEPIHPEENLDDLIADITADNLHTEADFGSVVGQEIL